MLSHEPGAILPSLAFAGMDRILFMAGDLAAPFFARWLDPDQASRAAEWAIRIVLAYVADPAPGTDLTDPDDTRALVRTFVLPGILALREPSAEFRSVSSTEPRPSTEPHTSTESPPRSITSTTSKGAVQ